MKNCIWKHCQIGLIFPLWNAFFVFLFSVFVMRVVGFIACFDCCWVLWWNCSSARRLPMLILLPCLLAHVYTTSPHCYRENCSTYLAVWIHFGDLEMNCFFVYMGCVGCVFGIVVWLCLSLSSHKLQASKRIVNAKLDCMPYCCVLL